MGYRWFDPSVDYLLALGLPNDHYRRASFIAG